MLCSNRPEGFGPRSTLSSPLPTSCFTDTIIIPLPVWLALLFLPILFILSLRHRKLNFNPSTQHLRSAPSRNCAFDTVSIIYYLLILANVLMATLEIVRLSLLHFGIGLIPFALVGLFLGAAIHFTSGFSGKIRGWWAINMVLWIGGMAVSIVSVIGLAREGPVDTLRKGTKYPLSDQVIDVAVIAGVYAAVAFLEVSLVAWRRVRRQRAEKQDVASAGGFDGVRDPNSTVEIVGKHNGVDCIP